MAHERARSSPWDARAADLPRDLSELRLRELLEGTGEEIAVRLGEGDPLGLGPIAMVRLREEGYLLSPDRVHLRLAARIAFEAAKIGDQRKLRRWLHRGVPKVLRELLREDEEANRLGVCDAEQLQRNWAWLAKLLRIEPEIARAAAVSFNRLGKGIRTAFFDTVLLRRPASVYAELHGVGVDEVQERVRLAAEAISKGTAADEPEGDGGEPR